MNLFKIIFAVLVLFSNLSVATYSFTRIAELEPAQIPIVIDCLKTGIYLSSDHTTYLKLKPSAGGETLFHIVLYGIEVWPSMGKGSPIYSFGETRHATVTAEEFRFLFGPEFLTNVGYGLNRYSPGRAMSQAKLNIYPKLYGLLRKGSVRLASLNSIRVISESNSNTWGLAFKTFEGEVVVRPSKVLQAESFYGNNFFFLDQEGNDPAAVRSVGFIKPSSLVFPDIRLPALVVSEADLREGKTANLWSVPQFALGAAVDFRPGTSAASKQVSPQAGYNRLMSIYLPQSLNNPESRLEYLREIYRQWELGKTLRGEQKCPGTLVHNFLNRILVR